MCYPQFSVLRFGAFRYKIDARPHPVEKDRLISDYEFEFYTEDCTGGLRNDGVFYPAQRGCCTLSRPGQRQDVVRAHCGYYLNISTRDPELCRMFDNLPDYFVLWNIAEVVGLIQQMIATEDENSLAGRMQQQSCVCRIIRLLSQYRDSHSDMDHNTYRHRKALLMADKHIREHLSEDLSLAVLARLCNLDPTYFHKLYTAAFGKTPAQSILAYRIAAAKTGLIEGKLSVEELAAKCGFSSQSYFCRKFKQVTGMTPLQYRNEKNARQ